MHLQISYGRKIRTQKPKQLSSTSTKYNCYHLRHLVVAKITTFINENKNNNFVQNFSWQIRLKLSIWLGVDTVENCANHVVFPIFLFLVIFRYY